jgi:hypothetical protein
MHGDVVDQEPLVGDGEDDDPDDGAVALGNGHLPVADDCGVVVGHRAGQHPKTLDVMAVGGVDERRDAGDVRPGGEPERRRFLRQSPPPGPVPSRGNSASYG